MKPNVGMWTSSHGRISPVFGRLEEAKSQSLWTFAPSPWMIGGASEASATSERKEPPKPSMTWQPWQLLSLTIRRPRSIAASAGDSCLTTCGAALSCWNPSTAVTAWSSSRGESRKFGIRSFSSQPRARSRSKMRGSWSFVRNQSCRVCGMWMKPKSRRWTAFEPSSVSSVPIGLASSKPGMAWHA